MARSFLDALLFAVSDKVLPEADTQAVTRMNGIIERVMKAIYEAKFGGGNWDVLLEQRNAHYEIEKWRPMAVAAIGVISKSAVPNAENDDLISFIGDVDAGGGQDRVGWMMANRIVRALNNAGYHIVRR